MSQRVYRVCRTIHVLLDGEGANQVGGRWNSSGRAVVYMAQSISLAVLENLVHMSKEDFPAGYVSVSASIPAELSILTDDDIRKDFQTPDHGNWATIGSCHWGRLCFAYVRPLFLKSSTSC